MTTATPELVEEIAWTPEVAAAFARYDDGNKGKPLTAAKDIIGAIVASPSISTPVNLHAELVGALREAKYILANNSLAGDATAGKLVERINAVLAKVQA